MACKFNVSITTALGTLIDRFFAANSAQQISNNMPNEVAHYETALGRQVEDGSIIEDESVFLDLSLMVANIQFAAEITPETAADNDAQQDHAMAMLSCADVRYNLI